MINCKNCENFDTERCYNEDIKKLTAIVDAMQKKTFNENYGLIVSRIDKLIEHRINETYTEITRRNNYELERHYIVGKDEWEDRFKKLDQILGLEFNPYTGYSRKQIQIINYKKKKMKKSKRKLK